MRASLYSRRGMNDMNTPVGTASHTAPRLEHLSPSITSHPTFGVEIIHFVKAERSQLQLELGGIEVADEGFAKRCQAPLRLSNRLLL